MPGFRPGGRPTFLRAQESRQSSRRAAKPKRPCSVAPSLREGVPCDARNPRPAQNSLRSLRSLRSDSCAESVDEAGFARASGSCASRLLQRGTPEQPTAKRIGRSPRGIRLAPLSTAEQRKALRARAQHASSTDSAQLVDRSVAKGVLRGPSRPEQRRAPAAALRAVRSGVASLPTFLSTQENRRFRQSRSPTGANSRQQRRTPPAGAKP